MISEEPGQAPETIETDDTSVLESRRVTHPKEKITLRQLLKWAFGPLASPNPDRGLRIQPFRTPKEWTNNSRYGARRRAKRIRLRNRLLAIKYSKRLGMGLTVLLLAGLLSFWAKFAFVYDLPSFIRVGSLQNVQAYVVYKSWWFGPPSFDLGAYHNLAPDNPELSLILQLDHYRDIITNPNEIVLVFTKNTNNNNG